MSYTGINAVLMGDFLLQQPNLEVAVKNIVKHKIIAYKNSVNKWV